MRCIFVLAWRAGSPLMMTQLRVVGRKLNRVSASVPLDPFLVFLFSFHPVVCLIPQYNPPNASIIIFMIYLSFSLSFPPATPVFQHLMYSHFGQLD